MWESLKILAGQSQRFQNLTHGPESDLAAACTALEGNGAQKDGETWELQSSQRNSITESPWWLTYGGFLKWWYPQNTPKWSFLVGKPMVVGYHHLRKHPYGHMIPCISQSYLRLLCSFCYASLRGSRLPVPFGMSSGICSWTPKVLKPEIASKTTPRVLGGYLEDHPI